MTDCTKKGPLYCSICDAKDQRISELEDGLEEALYMLGVIDLDGSIIDSSYYDPDPDAMKPGIRRALNTYAGNPD